jgi:hypothetical protein
MSLFNENDLEAQLAELQGRQHALRQLVASSGWKDLSNICEGAVTSRRQSVLATIASIRGTEDCFTLTRLGCEVSGIQFVLSLPHALLKELDLDIQRVVVERRENEDGTT